MAIWVDVHGDLQFPDECPSCQQAPAEYPIDARDLVFGIQVAWPHCAGCVAAHARRCQGRRTLKRGLIGGVCVFLGFVAAQFMSTGIEDSVLLTWGAWLGGLVAFIGILLAGTRKWMPSSWVRRGRTPHRIPGLSVGRVWWESDTPFPLPDRPLLLHLTFDRGGYEETILRENPGLAHRDLAVAQAMSRKSPSSVQHSAMSREEQDTVDSLTTSWHACATLGVLYLIFGAGMAHVVLAGRVTGYAAAHPAGVVALGITGALLGGGLQIVDADADVKDSRLIRNGDEGHPQVYVSGTGDVKLRGTLLEGADVIPVGVLATADATPTIHQCDIQGHSAWGVSFDPPGIHTGALLLDAKENWWGNANGPDDSSNDVPGGDFHPNPGFQRVSDGVKYQDWLSAPATQ